MGAAPHLGDDDLEAFFPGLWAREANGRVAKGAMSGRGVQRGWDYPMAGVRSGLDETPGCGGGSLKANAGALIGQAVEREGLRARGLDATLLADPTL